MALFITYFKFKKMQKSAKIVTFVTFVERQRNAGQCELWGQIDVDGCGRLNEAMATKRRVRYSSASNQSATPPANVVPGGGTLFLPSTTWTTSGTAHR